MGVSIFVMLAVDDHYLDPLEIIKWWYFIIPFFFLAQASFLISEGCIVVFLINFGGGLWRPDNLKMKLSLSNISFKMMKKKQYNYSEKPNSGKERMDGK